MNFNRRDSLNIDLKLAFFDNLIKKDLINKWYNIVDIKVILIKLILINKRNVYSNKSIVFKDII